MKKLAYITALGLSMMSMNALANTRDPAAEKQIQEHAQQLIKIVNKANDANKAQVIQEAEKYITPYIDANEMAKSVMGVHWRNATPEQRNKLVSGFKIRLRTALMDKVLLFRNQEVKVTGSQVYQKDANKVVVATTIGKKGAAEQHKVLFSTQKKGKDYIIYKFNVFGQDIFKAQQNEIAEVLKNKHKNNLDSFINELHSQNGGKK